MEAVGQVGYTFEKTKAGNMSKDKGSQIGQWKYRRLIN